MRMQGLLRIEPELGLRRRRVVAVIPGVVLAVLYFAAAAHAVTLYWGPQGHLAIARAEIDDSGVHVQRHFIRFHHGNSLMSVEAVDSRHLYWISARGIGRADRDGRHVNQRFMKVDARSLAVEGQHIYWVSRRGTWIGRANLNGTHQRRLVEHLNGHATALRADARHLYWSSSKRVRLDFRLAGHTWFLGSPGAIYRANLHGTNRERLIRIPSRSAAHLAVDDQYIYWDHFSPHGHVTIERAAVGGSAEPRGILTASANYFGFGGFAVDGQNVYYPRFHANSYPGISRADRDGANITPLLIPDVSVEDGMVAASSGSAGAARDQLQPRGKLVIKAVSRSGGDTRGLLVCTEKTRRSERQEITPDGKECALVRGKDRATLRPRPGRYFLRIYGGLGAGPCYSEHGSGLAPASCSRVRIKSRATKRLLWRVPNFG